MRQMLVASDRPTPEDLPGRLETLVNALSSLVGPEHVSTSAEDCAFFATDVFTHGAPALAVVAPGSTSELSRCVALCTSAGFAVIPRGGGLSYTAGYVPGVPTAITFDLRRLNRIVEINTTDLYVTVEAGCTWHQLFETLQPLGVRTPYFGPVSGHGASVGGTLSQGSIYYGSARYGSTGESVLALEVVLADGSVVSTGSSALAAGGLPFFRYYGPDLTGLFLGDCGSLGLKTRVTLRLIRMPSRFRFLSFLLDDYRGVLRAMSEIGRRGLAAECWTHDPYMHGLRLSKERKLPGFDATARAVRAGHALAPPAGSGSNEAALASVRFALHMVLEGDEDALVDWQAKEARAIVMGEGGRETGADIPDRKRASPFMGRHGNGTLNRDGRRYLPVHAICPHSRAEAVFEAAMQTLDQQSTAMEAAGVAWGCIICVVGTHALIVEPLIYWTDAANLYHRRVIEPAHLAGLPVHASNPGGTQLVTGLRDELSARFMELGCVHMQIGKVYPYREGLRPETFATIESIKRALDPHGAVNPGTLGLASDLAAAPSARAAAQRP
jgi:FAD/FMN-containing dehydrogenase